MKYFKLYCNDICINKFHWCDLKLYRKAINCPCKECILKINCSIECNERMNFFISVKEKKENKDKHI